MLQLHHLHATVVHDFIKELLLVTYELNLDQDLSSIHGLSFFGVLLKGPEDVVLQVIHAKLDFLQVEFTILELIDLETLSLPYYDFFCLLAFLCVIHFVYSELYGEFEIVLLLLLSVLLSLFEGGGTISACSERILIMQHKWLLPNRVDLLILYLLFL